MRGQRRQRQRRLLIAAAGRVEGDDQLGRRPQQPCLFGGHARRRRPELGRIEEPQRVAEGGEDRVVDVVALELSRLPPDVVELERQHRIEEVVQQLGAQRDPLGRRDRQRLEDQTGFEEVVFVGDDADARRLAGQRPAGPGRRRAAAVRTAGQSQ